MTIRKPLAKPEATAEYEAAGTRILADHAVAEMRKSVARLREELRSAFPPETAAKSPRRHDLPRRG